MADVTTIYHGSLVGFTPLTEPAQEWIAEHIGDDAQWLGNSFFAEARYADDIVVGMLEAGLEVK